MKKVLIFSIIINFVFSSEAQTDINNYKYVVIPLQYEFKKGKNPLKLSTLARYLFNKEGFTTYYEGETLSDDLFENRCLASYAEIVELKEGFRMTRLKILLKDCKDNIIFESSVGDSGINNHEKRYHEAFREAFASIEKLNYKYVPKIEKNDSEGDEISNIKNSEDELLINEKDSKQDVDNKPKQSETQTNSEIKMKETTVDKNNDEAPKVDNTLYAQKKDYGYQVVDSEPKVVMYLMMTSVKDVYLVKDKNALVYKEDGLWYYSENNGELSIPKPLKIKF